MEEFHNHKLQTLNAYNASAKEFAENTAGLHPDEQARKFLNLLPGKRILDLGCGPGRDAQVFVGQGFQVTGVDMSTQMVEMARSRVAAQFHVMDIENLNFPPRSFHGIWASASLLHIPKKNILQVFKILHSLLLEEGIFYLSLKKGTGEGLQSDPRYGGILKFWSFFEREEIEDIVKQSDFKVIESVISEKKSTYQGHPLWVNILCKKEKK
ncbi:MAG: class I SAM-dependent methyltransferase [Chlamydiales bacterium]